MDSLLREITALPGVFGCFVFSGERHVIGSKMPPIFRKENINSIANLLARTVQIGHTAQLDFKEIELRYNESLLMIKPLKKEALLILICEPNANKSLIAMTSGILAGEIEIAMARSLKLHPSSHSASRPTETIQASQIDKIETDRVLAPVLEQIQEVLAMAIGPIAGPVMKDNVEIWTNQNAPSISTLPALTKLLCTEIDDKNLEQKFIAEVKKIATR